MSFLTTHSQKYKKGHPRSLKKELDQENDPDHTLLFSWPFSFFQFTWSLSWSSSFFLVFFLGGAVKILGGTVRSGVTPGAVRSGAIPPPKTTPLHATVHELGIKDPVSWKKDPVYGTKACFSFFFRLNQYFGEELISGNQPPPHWEKWAPLSGNWLWPFFNFWSLVKNDNSDNMGSMTICPWFQW